MPASPLPVPPVPPLRFRPSTLVLCLHGALSLPLAGSALLLPGAASAQASLSTPATRLYRIGSGPLDDTLNRFARQAGISLSFTPQQVEGQRSPGLEGSFSVEGGLAALLLGSGHSARAQAPGHYVLQSPVPRAGGPSPPAGLSAAMPALATLPITEVNARRDRQQEVYDTAGSVVVITREEIDRLPPRNSADVLADVAGVYTSGSRMDPGLSVNIRGIQDFGRVNVMIDGTRQNYQQSGHGSNGSVYLDPELLGGVDIAKGPTSTVGGAGMIAGVVNFRTLEADDLLKAGQKIGGRVNATRGSNAYDFAGSAALGLRLREDTDLVMVVSRKKIGEFMKGRRGSVREGFDTVVHGLAQLSSQDQTSVLLKGTWRIAPGQRVKLSYIGLDAKFGEAPQSGVLGGISNHVQTSTLLANYDFKSPDQPWLDLKSSLYYTDTRNHADRQAGGPLDANAYQLQYQTSTVGATLENTARLALTPRNGVVLKTGGEFFHDWTTPKAQALTAGADLGTTALYTGSTPKGKRSMASLFAEASLLHDDWLEVTGGLRYDWYGLQGDGLMRVGSIANPAGVRPGSTTVYTRFETDRHGGAFAPKLTVAVKPVKPLQFFASVSRGLRPPAITEALMWGQHTGSLFPYYPNPNLTEERSQNAEVGLNANFDHLFVTRDRLRVKTAWFQSRIEHYISQARVMSPIDTSAGGSIGPYAYVNLQDPYRSKGLELQADYDTGTAFAGINYTHLLVKPGQGGYDSFPLGSLTGYPANNLGQPGDANIMFVLPPRKALGVTAGLRLLDKRLVIGGRMRYQAPRFNTSVWTEQSNGYSQKSWHVYDLWASYEVNENITLRLAVNNLRDQNYSEMAGGSYFVAPGRTATATVSVRF